MSLEPSVCFPPPISNVALKLDPLLRLHAGREMVLDQRHLGDEIGGGDQRRLGVAAGDDDVQVRRARRQRGEHFVQRQIVVAQRDVQFVEHQQAEVRVAPSVRCALVPGARGGGDVAGAVLRLPGEALAHRVPVDLVAEAVEGVRSPVVQAPLMNCTTPTRRPRPSMRSARPKAAVDLPLPGPVWTISRPFSIGLGRDLGVLHRLALLPSSRGGARLRRSWFTHHRQSRRHQ